MIVKLCVEDPESLEPYYVNVVCTSSSVISINSAVTTRELSVAPEL